MYMNFDEIQLVYIDIEILNMQCVGNNGWGKERRGLYIYYCSIISI